MKSTATPAETQREQMTLHPADESLLRDVAGGKMAALGKLAGRYERSLLGLALGLLRGREDLARDAVQETWVRVIRFAGGFDGRSEVRTWLYRITVNQCRDLARWGARIPEELPSADPPGRETLDTLATADAQATLRSCVSALPVEQREAVLLCYHAEMTHAAAAEILEIPLGTLKSRLHAALESLRADYSREDVA